MGQIDIVGGGVVRKVNSGAVTVSGVHRKVSQAYAVIGGIIRQVWNSYTPKSYGRTIFNGGTWVSDCYIPAGSNYYIQIPASDVNEALNNGYTKLRASYTFRGGNYSTGYGTQLGISGAIMAYADTKSPYAEDAYGSSWHVARYSGNSDYSSENVLIASFNVDLVLERNTYCQIGVKNRSSSEQFYMYCSYGGAYPYMAFSATFVR